MLSFQVFICDFFVVVGVVFCFHFLLFVRVGISGSILTLVNFVSAEG